MAQAQIAKIGILGILSEQAEVVDVLYDFGGIQLVANESATSASEQLSKLDYQIAQLKFTLDFVAKYAPQVKIPLKQKLEQAMSRGITVSLTEIGKIAHDFAWQPLVKQAEDLEADINLRQSKIAALRAEINELVPWQGLKFKLHDVTSAQIVVKLGVVAASAYEKILTEVAAQKLPVELVKVYGDEREVKFAIIYLKDVSELVAPLLMDGGFREVVLPKLQGTPHETVIAKEAEVKELEKQLTVIIARAGELVNYEYKLKIVYDNSTWERDKLQAAQQSVQGERTFYLTGFMNRFHLDALRKKLSKITANVELTELDITEDDDVPVLLENNRLVSPFEAVTNIYGAPKSDELDPTPYLAPFFIIFFGLCLSDAGYGLLLGGFSFLAIKLLKIPRDKQGFLRLLVYAGISTFIVGTLFGGWFGLVLEDLPQNGITKALLAMKVIDPVTNPLTMLVFSLILGGLQVISGVIVNLYYQITKKDWGKVFDAVVWLFFIFGLVFWLVAGNVLKEMTLVAVGKYWIYAGVAVLVLTQGRRQKNIFLKIPLGILSLYGLVGYFSDIMSYSRLLALGLSTGIIAMVINMVAMLFKDMIPFIGWPIAILILIGGHIFNLAINALGSFIHSGRLQYVEFFPKFMEGGGTRFKPLERQAKYVDTYSLHGTESEK